MAVPFNTPMHLILTGATGIVGSSVLKRCLEETAITKLTILSRRPIPEVDTHSKAQIIIQNDFTGYSEMVVETLKGAEACIWALGVSQSEVTREEYVKITYDYTMVAAKAFGNLSNPFRFVFVSGEGADPTEKRYPIFSKIKGRTEKHLYELSKEIPSLKVYSARPGMIDPRQEGLRPLAKNVGGIVLKSGLAFALTRFYPSHYIGTETLSKVLVNLALGDGSPLLEGDGLEAEGRTLRNTALRRLGGL